MSARLQGLDGRAASTLLVVGSGLAPPHEVERWTDAELATVTRAILAAHDAITQARQRLTRHVTPPTC